MALASISSSILRLSAASSCFPRQSALAMTGTTFTYEEIYRVTHEVVLQGFVYIKAKVAFECKEQKLKLRVDTVKVTG